MPERSFALLIPSCISFSILPILFRMYLPVLSEPNTR